METLSSQELRTRLVERLQKSGTTDRLKSQLRSRIFAEIGLKPKKMDDLETQAIDSLLMHYLDYRKMEFTLSVFSSPVLMNVFKLLSKKQRLDKDIQTNVEMEDLLSFKLRELDKTMGFQQHAIEKTKLLALEQRMLSFQRDLEEKTQEQLVQTLEEYKQVELTRMRIEEKKQYQQELQRQRAEFEQKLLDQKQSHLLLLEDDQKKVEARERELERQNLELRQKLYEETNRMIFKETSLRNEAELQAKELKLERDLLQKRYQQVESQLVDLQGFKERYIEKSEDTMAQYKIDLNKEFTQKSIQLEVEKTRLEGERLLLSERQMTVERMMASVAATEQERERLSIEKKNLQQQLSDTVKEKEELMHQVRELQLKVLTQENAGALEFEIGSLKKQLTEAENMAEKRQQEYQELLKTLVAPKDDLREELSKARVEVSKWQGECQQLVMKLEYELNRGDSLSLSLEKAQLRVKELERELADTRLLLHQSQTVLGEMNYHRSPYITPKIFERKEEGMGHFDDLYARLSIEHSKAKIPDPYTAIESKTLIGTLPPLEPKELPVLQPNQNEERFIKTETPPMSYSLTESPLMPLSQPENLRSSQFENRRVSQPEIHKLSQTEVNKPFPSHTPQRAPVNSPQRASLTSPQRSSITTLKPLVEPVTQTPKQTDETESLTLLKLIEDQKARKEQERKREEEQRLKMEQEKRDLEEREALLKRQQEQSRLLEQQKQLEEEKLEQERLAQQKKEEERLALQKKEEERLAQEKKEDKQLAQLALLENDPTLTKYMDQVKEKRGIQTIERMSSEEALTHPLLHILLKRAQILLGK
ncbi:hypothetical protein EDD86DRAFT_255001 [Gorgonomyces haynaldii]|nr:hypothetical protein EDD86DRAFT_255001 [Gorgonomyces haynaldii]